MTIAGFTSTGSKRPTSLFGIDPPADVPLRMRASAGACITDDRGREYLDFIMALGAVTLGYSHPKVIEAVREALDHGVVGSLAPVEEELLAQRIKALVPWIDSVRFLKTGAEAVAAAVRLARTHTGREQVLGCGYHGWLDGTSRDPGVPVAVQRLFGTVPFNDPERTRDLIREAGDGLAAVVVEPVVEGEPGPEWLGVLRDETARIGAVLVFDEIKTGFRVALGGAAQRFGVVPDLAVFGKALGNGFPLAAVAGAGAIMAGVAKTWISSTLATEVVALAAARASLEVTESLDVPGHLARVGHRLLAGLGQTASRYPGLVTGARGIAEMCFLGFRDDAVGSAVAIGMARRGVLFKRTAYNFVSLAHGPDDVDRCLQALDQSLSEIEARC
jgi:glutamate-1-semialdehyde 2,1-aminomutase